MPYQKSAELQKREKAVAEEKIEAGSVLLADGFEAYTGAILVHDGPRRKPYKLPPKKRRTLLSQVKYLLNPAS